MFHVILKDSICCLEIKFTKLIYFCRVHFFTCVCPTLMPYTCIIVAFLGKIVVRNSQYFPFIPLQSISLENLKNKIKKY